MPRTRWQFDDAKPEHDLQEIHPGDQVNAPAATAAPMAGANWRPKKLFPDRSAIFSATVNSVDASSSTLTVHDLSSKKNRDGQEHRKTRSFANLPPEMAQRMAAVLETERREGQRLARHRPMARHRAPALRPTAKLRASGRLLPAATAARRQCRGARRPGGPPDLQQPAGPLTRQLTSE
jgi:hypothetical protein